MYVCKQFGLGDSAYVFPTDAQIAFNWNFGNAKPNSTTLPGVSGAFDNYGAAHVPTEIGNINVQFWIKDYTASQLQVLTEAVNKMIQLGKQPLSITPIDTLEDDRYVWARLNSSQLPQNVANKPHVRQRVTLDFRVDYPYFLGHPDTIVWAGEGYDTSSGVSTVASQIENESVTDGSTVSVTNNGNYPAPAYIRWDINGNTTNPTVYRENADGDTVESVQYTGSLVNGDTVEIDAHDYSAIGVTNAYSNVTVANGKWLTIPIGTSTLKVSGTFASNADLTIFWWDTWV